MKGRKVLFSSARGGIAAAVVNEAAAGNAQNEVQERGRDDWRTPLPIIELVRDVFGGAIDLDPCADMKREHWIAAINYTGPFGTGDGLRFPWNARCVFINPPYSTAVDWAYKIATEYEAHSFEEAIWLIPARTETKHWRIVTRIASAACFPTRRIRFVNPDTNSVSKTGAFPSALVYLGDFPGRFAETMLDLGPSWKPMTVQRYANGGGLQTALA